MTVIVRYDREELENVIRREIARSYNSKVTSITFKDDEEMIDIILGAEFPPERGGPGDL